MTRVLPIMLLAALALAGAMAAEADALAARKLHFTSTYTSYALDVRAQGDEMVAMVLPPSAGTVYVGSITYTASSPLRIVVLHALDGPAAGQPAWEIPGQDTYAASYLGANATSGSFTFVGTSVILHSAEPDAFVATASVDAFARGAPAEIRVERIEVIEAEQPIELVRAEVPVTLPLHGGILDDERVLYTITDSSDEDLADELTEKQEWPVSFAPPLAALLEPTEGAGTHEPNRIHVFRNGVKGEGLEGYQVEVFGVAPGDAAYTPASSLVYVEWKRNLNPEILVSIEEIEQAVTDSRISLEEAGIVLNVPQVSWPGGALPLEAPGEPDGADAETAQDDGGDAETGQDEGGDAQDGDAASSGAGESGEEASEDDAGEAGAKEDVEMAEEDAGDADMSDDANGAGEAVADEDSGANGEPDAKALDIDVPEAYQASEVNVEEMTATFIARRAWGPDGQTVYHIMAGATPSGPARVTGTADSHGMQNYTATPAVADLYYFRGGLKGDGALGSQPSVAGVAPGTDEYTPLWRVHVVEWTDENDAAIVETRDDIDHLVADEAITVSAARPLGHDLVVNAPVIDPFWSKE